MEKNKLLSRKFHICFDFLLFCISFHSLFFCICLLFQLHSLRISISSRKNCIYTNQIFLYLNWEKNWISKCTFYDVLQSKDLHWQLFQRILYPSVFLHFSHELAHVDYLLDNNNNNKDTIFMPFHISLFLNLLFNQISFL